MFHISDFILPKKLIEAACQSKGVGFVDLEVCLEDPKEFALINNKLYIGEQTSIEATYWEIIKGYLNISHCIPTSWEWIVVIVVFISFFRK